MKQSSRMSRGVDMRVELSPGKVEKRKAQKSVETSIKSSKYEKDWKVIIERLIQALKDENKYMRLGAAGALGELGDVRAVEPLTEASKDKDSNVREMAIWALKKIGNHVKGGTINQNSER
nr:HEAT repeat domain-containing protein [Candidatus Freyarchaeota archaeon]